MHLNKREDGSIYETKAIEYLLSNGFELIERNYRYHKMGEIDIIGFHKELIGNTEIKYLVFAEVKHRRDNKKGEGVYAVNYLKQRQICRVSKMYLLTNKYPENTPVRYDVISIDGENISWIRNAFEYIN